MNPIARAKVYRFLAEAFLYPTEVWPEDLPLLSDILEVVGLSEPSLIAAGDFNLVAVQAEHRHTFGTSGSLVYETDRSLHYEFKRQDKPFMAVNCCAIFEIVLGGAVR